MQYPFIKTSPDGKLIQIVDSIDSKNFGVVYHVNVDAHQKAVLGKVEVFDKEDDLASFTNECAIFGIVPTSATVLVKFIFDLLPDSRDHRLLMTFPADKEFYIVPGKPRAIAVASVNPPGSTTIVSQTGGEAL